METVTNEWILLIFALFCASGLVLGAGLRIGELIYKGWHRREAEPADALAKTYHCRRCGESIPQAHGQCFDCLLVETSNI